MAFPETTRFLIRDNMGTNPATRTDRRTKERTCTHCPCCTLGPCTDRRLTPSTCAHRVKGLEPLSCPDDWSLVVVCFTHGRPAHAKATILSHTRTRSLSLTTTVPSTYTKHGTSLSLSGCIPGHLNNDSEQGGLRELNPHTIRSPEDTRFIHPATKAQQAAHTQGEYVDGNPPVTLPHMLLMALPWTPILHSVRLPSRVWPRTCACLHYSPHSRALCQVDASATCPSPPRTGSLMDAAP